MTRMPMIYQGKRLEELTVLELSEMCSVFDLVLKLHFVPRYEDTDTVLVASSLLSRDGFKYVTREETQT